MVVTKGNLGLILKTLDIQDVVKIEDGAHMLDFHENQMATFDVFYKELVRFIYDASMSTSQEDDYNRIIDAFTTPAQRIIKLLMTLKERVASKDSLATDDQG